MNHAAPYYNYSMSGTDFQCFLFSKSDQKVL